MAGRRGCSEYTFSQHSPERASSLAVNRTYVRADAKLLIGVVRENGRNGGASTHALSLYVGREMGGEAGRTCLDLDTSITVRRCSGGGAGPTTTTMARTGRSVRAATAVATTACLLLLLLAAAAEAARVQSRDLLVEGGGSAPVALSKEQPPDGHLSYRVVEGLIEKATGKSARLDLEKPKDEREKPLLSIP